MQTITELEEYLAELDMTDAEFFIDPDYVSVIIGSSEDGRLVYDYDLMIEHLMQKDGMSQEDAMDFLNENTMNAISHSGHAPIVMTRVHY